MERFSDSDTDSSSSATMNKRRRRTREENLSTNPLNFVTATAMPSQENENNNNNNNDSSSSSRETEGLGLGFEAGSLNAAHSNDEDNESFLQPIEFGRRIAEGVRLRRGEMDDESKKSQTAWRRRGGSDELGQFEKHTKGFGKKMLEKMGYKGGGLGKNEQGISAPIQPTLLPKNIGIGFGSDYNKPKPIPPALQESSNVLPQVSQPGKKNQWSQKNRSKKKKGYVTEAELLAEKEEEGVEELVVQKVIDMRGPQVRILTNLANLNAEAVRKDDELVHELPYNVNLMVDLTKLDVQKLDRDLNNEREAVACFRMENEKLEKEKAFQQKQLESMEYVDGVLDRLRHENSLNVLNVESLFQGFQDVQRQCSDEYELCKLFCMRALPFIVPVFRGCDPLQNPSYGLNLMFLVKHFLEGDACFDFSDSPSPYTQLLMEVVSHAVRLSGTNTWNAREPEPMLKFLETWEKVLPPSVLQTILDTIVVPKLSYAIDTWDPHSETVSIHVWLHPWLPLLRHKLEILFQTVQFKLAEALRAWHPSDGSAYAILSPWRNVLDLDNWEIFIGQHIVPKLVKILQDFQVNPLNQQLDEFCWVMSWASAIPVHQMVTMLSVWFFPKWQQCLYHWLGSNPNFEEVARWYLGWKGLLPPELLANERIRDQLNVGLDMMNQAVEGVEVVQPGPTENISYHRVTDQRPFEAQQKATAYAKMQALGGLGNESVMDDTSANEMSVKEAVEAFALQNNLLFKPKPGRYYNGFQIYTFGKKSIYVDFFNQKVFSRAKDGWLMVSLDELLEMHNNPGFRRC